MGLSSANPEVVQACLGLLPLRLLACACFSRSHCLGPAPVEVIGSGLQQRSLARACFRGCPWLRSYPTEVSGLGSVLLPRQSLPHTCSCRDHLQGPTPAEVTGLGLLHQRSLIQTQSHRGLWLWPESLVVTLLYLFLWRSLPQVCSGGRWQRSLAEVTGSGLFPHVSLVSLICSLTVNSHTLPMPFYICFLQHAKVSLL